MPEVTVPHSAWVVPRVYYILNYNMPNWAELLLSHERIILPEKNILDEKGPRLKNPGITFYVLYHQDSFQGSI
jgi:hypothetical protein